MKFDLFYENERNAFDLYLMHESLNSNAGNLKIEEAMLYSLKAGGKRVRPLLLLMVLRAFGIKETLGYGSAMAVEYIHTYSLIHDDLPAMDDDDLRRGMPSNHIMFGEATAILAGDALLTKAFETLANEKNEPQKMIRIIRMLAEAAGHQGMIAGQQEDMDGENSTLSLDDMRSVHMKKTGALLKFCFTASGVLANCDEKMLSLLTQISDRVGIAYQIRDDILDVIGTEEELGKPVGSDVESGKSTYPEILGLKEAKKLLTKELQEAEDIVEKLDVYCQSVQREFDRELFSTFIQTLELKG